MSRRLRIEVEKAKQLKDELAEEEDKLRKMNERIFSPLIWRTITNGPSAGIFIQDLQANHYDEVIKMIEEHYTHEDVVFRNTKISEERASLASWRDRIRFRLNDKASIMAIDGNNENAIAGCLILTMVHKADFGRTYSRSRLIDGKIYQSIMEFYNYINRKSDVFEAFQCDSYLRYYLLCIKDEYRGRRIGYNMMNCGLDVARHLKAPVAFGIFSSHKTQKLARKLGMTQILYELKYVKWTDKNDNLIFCNPGEGNYACAAMAGVVPPPPEPEPVVQPDPPKLTRSEKKKLKAKLAALKEKEAAEAKAKEREEEELKKKRERHALVQ